MTSTQIVLCMHPVLDSQWGRYLEGSTSWLVGRLSTRSSGWILGRGDFETGEFPGDAAELQQVIGDRRGADFPRRQGDEREELGSGSYFIQLGERDEGRIRLVDRKMYAAPNAAMLMRRRRPQDSSQ